MFRRQDLFSWIRFQHNRKIAEVVDRQTEGILLGDDQSERLLEQHPQDSEELGELFGLTGQIYSKLVPVAPSEQFARDLKARLHELQAAETNARAAWKARHKRAGNASQILGTAVSVLAVVAFVARIIGSVVMLIIFISGQRRKPAVQA